MRIRYELFNSLGTLVLNLEDGYEAWSPGGNSQSTGFTLTIEDPNREPKSLKVERVAIGRLLELIGSARINPFAPGMAGLDGATHTLTIGEDCREASYTWWCNAGKGWNALDRIADEFLMVARNHFGEPFTNIGEVRR